MSSETMNKNLTLWYCTGQGQGSFIRHILNYTGYNQ